MRIEKELGYILHQKPFSETSVLLDVFTQQYGRVGLIAKGAKRPKSPLRACLFPFKLLSFSFVGKSELKTVTHLEEHEKYSASTNYSHGNQLIFGLYVNELILRFLKKEDPHPELFSVFHLAIGYLFNIDNLCQQYQLSKNHISQLILRSIEMALLSAVGYGIQFDTIAQSHHPISKTDYYYYDPVVGFNCSQQDKMSNIPGALLNLMTKLDLNKLDDFFKDLYRSKINLSIFLGVTKKILRQSLDYHLGDKKIHTRELAGIEWEPIQE